MRVDPSWIAANGAPPVTIVGSGPAGAALAMRLSERGIDSLILEAGYAGLDEASQDHYRGEVRGDPYYELHEARLRVLGGTTAHWEGQCRELDAHDFEARAHVPDSGWPIAKTDLDPHLDRARALLKVPPAEDIEIGNGIFIAGRPNGEAPWFGHAYEAFWSDDPRARLCLETAVERIEARDGRIATLHLRTPGGQMTMTPRTVVVATGGVENSRLLLWSNATSPEPVAPSPATGRYWMEHPIQRVGSAELDHVFLGRFPQLVVPTPLSARREMLMRHEIMNGSIHIKLAPPPRGLKRQVMALGCRVPALSTRLAEIAGVNMHCGATIFTDIEQAPDALNRVELDETARDAFGVPRPILYWKRREREYRTSRVLFELLGRHLVLSGEGRARAEEHTINEGGYPLGPGMPGGYHHMGGTRMGPDPRTAVVDRNLRLHGIANGYVAGSSVFPTSGYANPTLTIVQLSLRLGDHLALRAHD